MNSKITIDGFRFIDNLHTTARQLPVFTEITCLLNNKQLHKRILEGLLVEWSYKEEIANEVYRLSKGKITNANKKTIALRYHLELSPSLGLVIRHNDLFINSKLSKLFAYLYKSETAKIQQKKLELIFYIFQFLNLDADGTILCLSQLYGKSEISQTDLQKDFKRALNERLISKQKFVNNSIIKSKISEKYKSINYIWRKPEKYAEHIIAPRYEWLAYLGLVKIERESRKTLYSLTEYGINFIESLPSTDDLGKVKDISDSWMSKAFFSFISLVLRGRSVNYSELSKSKQSQFIGISFEKAMKVVQSSMSFKLPIKETFFFVCIDLLLNENIIINFDDISITLESVFIFNNKSYLLKESGRMNEGYITITNLR